MKWFYRCPYCGSWLSVEWTEKDNCFICTKCNQHHFPPSPCEQIDAFVDDQMPPEEMEEDVYRLKGKICTVPGCTQRADILDHRISWEHFPQGTSVENLFPICMKHHSSKGEKEYVDWLKEELTDQRKRKENGDKDQTT